MRRNALPDIIARARAVRESLNHGTSFSPFPAKEALDFAWALTVLADREDTRAEVGDKEAERLKKALRQVKAFVVGERSPNWHDDAMTYLTRGKIADVCDFALAHPQHPRDVHLTIEKRSGGISPLGDTKP